MNRAMRRQAEKISRTQAKPARARFRPSSNVAMLHEIEMVFGPIEIFLEQLSTGEVQALGTGEIIFRDPRGEVYEAVPAVRGFAAALTRICTHFGLPISDKPVIKLCNRLEACMPINPNDVEAAKAEIAKFRQAYRKMDLSVIKGLVTTELISIELDRVNK